MITKTQLTFTIIVGMMIATSANAQLHVNGVGDVGIGTLSPSEALTVERTDAGTRIQLTGISSTGNEAPQMIWKRARSNAGTPDALLAGDNLGAFSFRGYDGTDYSGSRGFINVQATEDWAPGANGTQMLFQVTQNGTNAPFAVMQITNDGKVFINGTQLSVPDYVFAEDYSLMGLDELSQFIDKNKHLPGVASAKEVNSNGLDLGGSQLSILEKVEELTLYTIQQHEKLKKMDALQTAYTQLLTAYHKQQEKLDKVDKLEQMVNQLMQSDQGKSVYTSLK